ncbi:hypothetical protein [Dokdonia sp.]|uniref:hypothetical protein n=1 Tax=Dokdonia sp. TaxID=2024995 RepID=UPI003262EE18
MRGIVIILLSFLLSLSILGPSVLVLLDNHSDIEVALELGEEENKKENIKELDLKNSFFQSHSDPVIANIHASALNSAYYLHFYGTYVIDVKSPPPEDIA